MIGVSTSPQGTLMADAAPASPAIYRQFLLMASTPETQVLHTEIYQLRKILLSCLNNIENKQKQC